MSWILRQAEDILNRVDQQTNAVLHQNAPTIPPRHTEIEFTSDRPTYTPTPPPIQPVVVSNPNPPVTTTRSTITPTRRTKKTDESDLIDYLNSSTPINSTETKKPIRSNAKTRTASSSSSIPENDFPSEKRSNSLSQDEHQKLLDEQIRLENEIQTYKRQQIQYQHQIAESDALLRDLRLRENDSQQNLSSKDSQLAQLRSRLIESNQQLEMKTSQYEQLQTEYTNLFENSSTKSCQIQQNIERILAENERLINENQELKLKDKQYHHDQQQQTNYTKNLLVQFEQEMNDYKIKAQRILQDKDKLIFKLKDLVQQRSSTPTLVDQFEQENTFANDESTVLDITTNPSTATTCSSIEFDALKNENELFKQELQTRELTIRTLRHDLQEMELLNQQNEEQCHEQIKQLTEQLQSEQSRLFLIEQDYLKLKSELTNDQQDFQQEKQYLKKQVHDYEKELERLRTQLTSKIINQTNDEELEKRLQTLTESLIHKQTIIETLQTDKSSLNMQLERLEKRLDDYEMITTKASIPTSIHIDENEHYENLRYRVPPLLRETPYDVDLTKKVKRAANQLDHLGFRLTSVLRRYPVARLGVLFYIVILHLWTFIVLFVHTPESHSNTNSFHLKDKL